MYVLLTDDRLFAAPDGTLTPCLSGAVQYATEQEALEALATIMRGKGLRAVKLPPYLIERRL